VPLLLQLPRVSGPRFARSVIDFNCQLQPQRTPGNQANKVTEVMEQLVLTAYL